MESATYKHLTWKETKPGRWEREIDEVEQFYTTLARRFEGSGRTFFAMTAHVSLSIAKDPTSHQATELRLTNALRVAWLRLRYDHPTIASWVEEDRDAKVCKKIYQAFSDAEDTQQSTWLEETFKAISTSQSGSQWCNSDPPVPKLPTIFLLNHPVASDDDLFQADIVLRAHHDIIDGIGSLHLLNNLVKYASQAFDHPESFQVPQFQDEWKNLSPPFRVAAAIPASLTPDQEARLKAIMAENDSIRKAEIATVPFKQGPTVPGRHQRVSMTLSPEDTERLLLACKKLGASVTHVYHAALALSVRDLQEKHPAERKVRYINYSLINERSHCESPYSSPQHAASVYHSVSGQSLAIDLTVPGLASSGSSPDEERLEFCQTVEKVKDYYLAIRDDKEHIFFVPSYWTFSTPPYPSGTEAPPVPPPNQAPSASISSMGVVDKILSPTQGKFELDDPWVTGEELGTGLGVFLGTYRGSLCLSAAYNDVWHDEAEARAFLDKCNNIVLTHLLSNES
ncbi:hypothetical protein N7457_008399 [Penicillium paradoxum]|uniref:uncharacterized protein n=1 Tax=Penicillium paradoxum TaxID=176176 RepID=UPI002548489C|nr:uncharacterized protein N7457_008399 [Penicillium paradoxum]KAJ5773503.1 hypothetical protein N7457_008399 [Penicillium paradoxum]